MPQHVRELRLAVVCYGGVSLAIYMHGITKEIHKLVLASAGLEQHPDESPFKEDTTENAYWELLRRLRDEGDAEGGGVRLRVVVDIISGTSAGGINGVFLAKALAGNYSQDALKQLWFEKGDIKQLLRGWSRVPAILRALWIAYRAARNPLKVKPPLKGDAMCEWLQQALDGMEGTTGLADVDSLVPPGQEVTLSVPVTDFHGYTREIPLYDPRFVRDRTHRHVIQFRHDNKTVKQLGPDFNPVLGFAARATSSFPGAFPPVSFTDFQRAVPDRQLKSVAQAFFRHYELAGFDPGEAYFIDGGVLDNFPFHSAIDVIPTKKADVEVDRRLIYVEPDPGGDGAASAPSEAPGIYRTVFGGYAGIPRNEPILDDLLKLARRNEAVLRVRDVIESSFDSVRDRVSVLLAPLGPLGEVTPTGAELLASRSAVESMAVAEAGFAADTYRRMRIRTMVEDYAEIISHMCGFPNDSYHANFVLSVMRSWADRDGLLAQDADDELRQKQSRFLSSFDLSYHQRRVRFLISAINWLYSDARAREKPARPELDEMKRKLYSHLTALQSLAAKLAADPAVQGRLNKLFAPSEIRHAIKEDEVQSAGFVSQHWDELLAMRDAVQSAVEAALAPLEEGLHRDLLDFLDLCENDLAADLLTRYVGFPFWDVLVYPIQAMSGVGERDHVEVYRVSPQDVGLLVDEPEERSEKLKGMSLFHFGAFFSRQGRERDYLWGRLDGAERLIKLLLDVRPQPSTRSRGDSAALEPRVSSSRLGRECLPVFRTILREERGLHHADDLVSRLTTKLDNFEAGGSQAPRSPG